MKSKDALRILAEVTAYQWGMVTSAQARTYGITRLDLSRLTDAGHLKRLAHGIYKDSGAPSDQFEDLRAAWLSTDPKVIGEARLLDRASGVVIAGASAAHLHQVGDLWAGRHDFVTPKRRQSQRAEIRYRQRVLAPGDVTLAEGLPVMTIERTISDLVDEVGDLSLVADALRDAALQRNLNLNRLRKLLQPLAERNGFKRGDGNALLNRLLEIAGLDADTVARRVAADASLGSLVAANYLGGLSKADLDRLVMTPGMQRSIRAIQDTLAKTLAHSLAPQIAAINASADAMIANIVKSGALDSVAKSLTDQLVTSDAIKNMTQGWAKTLSAGFAIKPETLAAIRAVQKVPHGRA
ncbi:MAG: type IV toxin-antitoxin system AbiEi family antitoxin domain-containing protein [Dermatophilaceae bacterium]